MRQLPIEVIRILLQDLLWSRKYRIRGVGLTGQHMKGSRRPLPTAGICSRITLSSAMGQLDVSLIAGKSRVDLLREAVTFCFDARPVACLLDFVLINILIGAKGCHKNLPYASG